MTNYITTEELKYTEELTGFAFADNDINNGIPAASRAIDNLCHRRFWKDETPNSVRYYTAQSSGYLRIDDLVELTTLRTGSNGDGTFPNAWTANTDFILRPLNAAADGWPWTAIETHRAGLFTLPTTYPRMVEVTGRFGWQEVPLPIKTATTMIAARLVKRMREAPFGVAGIGIDGVAVRIANSDPDVRLLLEPYIRAQLSLA